MRPSGTPPKAVNYCGWKRTLYYSSNPKLIQIKLIAELVLDVGPFLLLLFAMLTSGLGTIWLLIFVLNFALLVWMRCRLKKHLGSSYVGPRMLAGMLLAQTWGHRADFPDGLSDDDLARLQQYRDYIVGPIESNFEEVFQRSHSGIIEMPLAAPRYVKFFRKGDAVKFKLQAS